MRVGIHQPHYLPWLRYFDKIARSDCFVVLDDAQFNRNGWQNRNRIKGPDGAIVLTVPVLQGYQQSLLDVRCNQTVNWPVKHWRSIEQHYRKTPFFKTYRDELEQFYRTPWESLNQLNLAMLELFLKWLGIGTRIVTSHTFALTTSATQRLADICKAVGATEYLTGAYALEAYLDPQVMEAADVRLVTHVWECPEYPQTTYPQAGFIGDLAILDLLFNHGPDTMQILQSRSRVEGAPVLHQ